MKLVLALLAVVLSAATSIAEPILPDQPRLRDFPRGPFGSIALYTTTVAKGRDGTIHVMQGFIWGRPNGKGSYIVRNPKTGLSCSGETVRMPDRSGKGDLRCSFEDQPLGVMPLYVPAGIYGRFKGTSTGNLIDPAGRQIGVFMTRWAAGSFPDPIEMIAAFD